MPSRRRAHPVAGPGLDEDAADTHRFGNPEHEDQQHLARLTENDTSSTATTGPYALRRCDTSMAAPARDRHSRPRLLSSRLAVARSSLIVVPPLRSPTATIALADENRLLQGPTSRARIRGQLGGR